jgi:DNA-binding transcriptional MerR regulator
MAEHLTIGKMAQRCGLTPHTLRYYERIGLIQSVARGTDGHRRYSAQDIAWVSFITRLKATGMPISRMLEFAAFRRDGDRTVPARRALLEAHMDDVRSHIRELESCLAALQDKVNHYRNVESSMTSSPKPEARKGNTHGKPLRTRTGKAQ